MAIKLTVEIVNKIWAKKDALVAWWRATYEKGDLKTRKMVEPVRMAINLANKEFLDYTKDGWKRLHVKFTEDGKISFIFPKYNTVVWSTDASKYGYSPEELKQLIYNQPNEGYSNSGGPQAKAFARYKNTFFNYMVKFNFARILLFGLKQRGYEHVADWLINQQGDPKDLTAFILRTEEARAQPGQEKSEEDKENTPGTGAGTSGETGPSGAGAGTSGETGPPGTGAGTSGKTGPSGAGAGTSGAGAGTSEVTPGGAGVKSEPVSKQEGVGTAQTKKVQEQEKRDRMQREGDNIPAGYDKASILQSLGAQARTIPNGVNHWRIALDYAISKLGGAAFYPKDYSRDPLMYDEDEWHWFDIVNIFTVKKLLAGNKDRLNDIIVASVFASYQDPNYPDLTVDRNVNVSTGYFRWNDPVGQYVGKFLGTIAGKYNLISKAYTGVQRLKRRYPHVYTKILKGGTLTEADMVKANYVVLPGERWRR